MLCRGSKSGHAFTSITMQDNTTGFLTYGCTVRRYDLQAEYTSQVEQPHRHLLSNARRHCCWKGIEEKLAGFLKPKSPSNHLIRTPPMVRVRLSVELHPQHGVRFRRASAVKGEWLQPGEAIGNAVAQSYIFLIDYRHSNMIHRVTSVSVLAGVSVSAHHATGVVHTSKRTVAASGSVQLIPCQTKKKN